MEDKLNELSLVNALIFGLIIAAGYYVMFYSASNPKTVIANLNQNITTVKAEISKLDRKRQEGEKLKKEINKMEKRAESVYKYIPLTMSLEQGSGAVSQEARLAGLSIQSIQVSNQWDEKVTVASGEVDIKVQGQFPQMMVFLSEMTRKDQIYSIKSLKMSEGSQNQAELTLDVKIEFFKRVVGAKK